MKYPETKKDKTIDTYFGVEIEDPYRWLENDRSEETAKWVKRENEFTYEILKKISFRKQIKDRLENIIDYERISAPSKHGSFDYYLKNDGLQNQDVLYRKGEDGKEELFLDPNKFSEDGTTALDQIAFSKDGSLCAYSISEGGSDWRKIIIMDTLSKTVLEDTLIDVKFSNIAWYKEEGIYYSSYEKPEGSELSALTDQHKLYYHKLGTLQKEDILIFGDNTKRRYVGGEVTENQKFLIVSAANSTSGNELYYKDLSNPKANLVQLIGNFDSDFEVIDANDEALYIATNLRAPNYRLIKVYIGKTIDEAIDIIPETNNVLSCSIGAGNLFANYTADAISKVLQYDYEGNLIREVELPGIGTATPMEGSKKETTLYYTFSNYITSDNVYRFDPNNGQSTLSIQSKIDFDSELFESKQVFYTSKDGTKIPMILSYKKGIELNGKNPTLLYGYGGFNISLTPSFSTTRAVWLEMGGILAVANLRGGGEYGKEWHDAGTKMQKQNVFDDFIAAGEYLIGEKYTSSNFLAIQGGSNGGLLVGAVMTQRPELMKVALPAVGVLDMLRYHTFTAGAGWAYDYGTANDTKEMFDYLKGYSPVHNVKDGIEYPATLITTGDHDDRVVPAHSFKFAAGLQAKQTGLNPILIRIETNAGHGAGTPISKTIEQYADIYGFTLYSMGIKSVNFE